MQIDSGAGRVFFTGPIGVCAFILRRNREPSPCKFHRRIGEVILSVIFFSLDVNIS